MISPGTYDITCWQGATYDKTFTVTEAGVALNLTGYTSAMQVRSAADATATYLSLTSGTGITLGGTAGTIVVAITATQSSAIPAGSYAYDLELTLGGTVTRLLQGAFNVVGNVTR
jgi:alanine dehydrogenase